MSIANSFDPSNGRAIPEDQQTEDGLELDRDPADVGISFDVDVVGAASADPTAVPTADVVAPESLHGDQSLHGDDAPAR
jgi:hypothetical protein